MSLSHHNIDIILILGRNIQTSAKSDKGAKRYIQECIRHYLVVIPHSTIQSCMWSGWEVVNVEFKKKDISEIAHLPGL